MHIVQGLAHIMNIVYICILEYCKWNTGPREPLKKSTTGWPPANEKMHGEAVVKGQVVII